MGILDRFKLDGKVAVVTGASSGLGVAFAQALAEAGADLVLGARREERLADTGALVTAAGRTWVGQRTDVTKPEDCAALIALAMEKYGRVDILVNNAGVGTAVPATHETPEQFKSVIETNLMGCYWMAQEFARNNKGGGSIVNISSVLGITSSCLLIIKGSSYWFNTRSSSAMDWPQRNSRQCTCSWFLPIGDVR